MLNDQEDCELELLISEELDGVDRRSEDTTIFDVQTILEFFLNMSSRSASTAEESRFPEYWLLD
jgi:hypothetical protein